MADLDLVVKNASLTTSERDPRVDICIKGERIVDIAPHTDEVRAAQEIDASGLLAIPGLIDSHTHIRDPARPDREDFRTGTAAAAAGGITTIIEMPTSDPPVNSAQNLSERVPIIQQRAYVDFALYGGAGIDNILEIQSIAKAGAVAFKTFMTAPSVDRIPEFVGMYAATRPDLYTVMKAVAGTGLLHCFHCEDDSMIRMFGGLASSERKAGAYHASARPTICEDIAVSDVALMAAKLGARVQVVHVSSPRAVELARVARNAGTDISMETAPHYLTLSQGDLERFGALLKCNPPLRTEPDIELLWGALNSAQIDMIGNDHCPYLPSEVHAGLDDIELAPPGLPAIELTAALLFTALAKGKTNLDTLIRATSRNAATRFGLKGKGVLAPGYDADIAIVDLSEEWKFDLTKAFTMARENLVAYDGMPLRGRVVKTVVRGKLVYDCGEFYVDPGYGRWVPGRDYVAE